LSFTRAAVLFLKSQIVSIMCCYVMSHDLVGLDIGMHL